MNREEIKKKLLTEKNVNLIDTLEINSRHYAKTLKISEQQHFDFEYKYYEITENNILELTDNELDRVKQLFETNLGNIVY